MKVVVQDEYGSDVLRLEDVETPVAGRGEVLIRVIAASAFIGDWHVITGTPYAIRLVSGLGKPKQRVRGQDVAGKIAAIGEEVTRSAQATRCSAWATGRSRSTRRRGPTRSPRSQ
jgi:NADPH:quinone reductase-like Zn-dependent oxidoreductase